MKTREKASSRVIKMIIAIVVAAYVLFPFFLVVINSCKPTEKITENPIGVSGASFKQLYTNLVDVINNTHFLFWSAFEYSVIITVVSLVLLALFGAMAAWVICRNHTKWSTFIYFTFIASMIISVPGIIFAYLGFGGAMTVFILNGFIKGIPMDLEEAASIDGCSPEQTFFRIILPLLKPVITTVTILNGMWIWNDYLLPSMMLGQNGKVKTLPVAVQAFVGSYVKQWNLILAAALLAIVPIVILFFFAQKQIMEGMIEGAVKG